MKSGTENRAGVARPGAVGAEREAFAAGKFHFQLDQQAVFQAAVSGARFLPADIAAPPAVAEDRAQGVLAGLDQRRYIVCPVVDALVVVGPFRRKNIFTGAVAVGSQFEQAARARVKRGPPDRAGHIEFLAEQRGSAGLGQRGRNGLGIAFNDPGIGGNPTGRPVGFSQQAHRPDRWLGTGGVAGLVPDLDTPMACVTRTQWPAGINNVRRLVAFDPAAVPQVSFVPGQFFCTAGNPQAASHLPGAAAAGLDGPTQTRRALVEAERGDEVFAAETGNVEGGSGHGELGEMFLQWVKHTSSLPCPDTTHEPCEPPSGFGLRQPSGALEECGRAKAVEGRRSPSRCRANAISLRFMALVRDWESGSTP